MKRKSVDVEPGKQELAGPLGGDPQERKRAKASSKAEAKEQIGSEAQIPVRDKQKRLSRKEKRKGLMKADVQEKVEPVNVLGTDLSNDEVRRRQRQRELRDLALKQRAEGNAYKRPRKPSLSKGTRAHFVRQGKLSMRDTDTGSRPTSDVEVIVVPIFWNTRPDEKAQVLQCASAAERLLEKAGLKIGMDTSDAMTPGQKFQHWERSGVMVRLECGPRDALKQQCVLAISKSAGQLAQKKTFAVGPDLLTAVGTALGKELSAPVSVTAPLGGLIANPISAAKSAGLKSGDDLGGDFVDVAVGMDESRNKRNKKYKA